MSEPGAARDALPADAPRAGAAEKDAVRMEAVRIDGPSGPLIDGLDFRAVAGRRTIILGANGAGKSLALRLIQGLIAPTAGRVDVAGRPALVFQRPVLLRRSLRANILHALKIAGASAALRRERAGDLLELAGLTALAERPARVLSGGEQQRAALARALAAEPDILLLDEPTASLDPHAVQAFESIVSDVHAAGATILFVTHDRGQAKRLADDVIFLEKGRVVEAGPAGPFFERPATEAARAYMEGRLRIP